MKNIIKENKKLIIVAAAVLVVIVAVIWIVLGSCVCHKTEKVKTQNEGEYIYTYVNTSITYKSGDKTLVERVDEDNSKALQGFFNKKTKIEVSDDCSITENIAVTVKISDDNMQTYYLADDGCNIVKYNDEYYSITVSDRHIINDIFEKYGVDLVDYDELTAKSHIISNETTSTTEADTTEETKETTKNTKATEKSE